MQAKERGHEPLPDVQSAEHQPSQASAAPIDDKKRGTAAAQSDLDAAAALRAELERLRVAQAERVDALRAAEAAEAARRATAGRGTTGSIPAYGTAYERARRQALMRIEEARRELAEHEELFEHQAAARQRAEIELGPQVRKAQHQERERERRKAPVPQCPTIATPSGSEGSPTPDKDSPHSCEIARGRAGARPALGRGGANPLSELENEKRLAEARSAALAAIGSLSAGPQRMPSAPVRPEPKAATPRFVNTKPATPRGVPLSKAKEPKAPTPKFSRRRRPASALEAEDEAAATIQAHFRRSQIGGSEGRVLATGDAAEGAWAAKKDVRQSSDDIVEEQRRDYAASVLGRHARRRNARQEASRQEAAASVLTKHARRRHNARLEQARFGERFEERMPLALGVEEDDDVGHRRPSVLGELGMRGHEVLKNRRIALGGLAEAERQAKVDAEKKVERLAQEAAEKADVERAAAEAAMAAATAASTTPRAPRAKKGSGLRVVVRVRPPASEGESSQLECEPRVGATLLGTKPVRVQPPCPGQRSLMLSSPPINIRLASLPLTHHPLHGAYAPLIGSPAHDSHQLIMLFITFAVALRPPACARAFIDPE